MYIAHQNKQGKERVEIGEVRNIKPKTFVLVKPGVEWGVDELRKNPSLDIRGCPWVAEVSEAPDLVRENEGIVSILEAGGVGR